MKERPILFSAPMVRAILDGRKTQTRRIVKPQFGEDAEPVEMCATTPEGWQTDGHSGLWWDDCENNDEKSIRCPYGKPGDRLWVREEWRVGAWNLHLQAIAVDYSADNHVRREWLKFPDNEMFARLVAQSIQDCEKAGLEPYDVGRYSWPKGEGPTRWRRARFMPRWASRITLEITGVRVERLQDISEEDAKAEGIFIGKASGRYAASAAAAHLGFCTHSAKEAYGWLWESLNGPDSWGENPWVLVVEFRRLPQ